MKVLLFSLVLLGFFLSSNAQPSITPLNDICPLRRPLVVALVYAENQQAYSSAQVYSNLLTSFQTMEHVLSKEERGVPSWLQAYAAPYNQPTRTHNYALALSQLTSQIGAVIQSYVAADKDPELVLVLQRVFRETTNVQTYSSYIESLKSMGFRVITMDMGGTRQEAISTGTASLPYGKNVFWYPEDTELNFAMALTQAVMNNPGRACVVSGRTNIQTFDGAIYQHDEIGDFLLLQSLHEPSATMCTQSLELYIRKSQCEDSIRREACISGVGLRIKWNAASHPDYDHGTKEFLFVYDRQANDLVITYDGHVLSTDFLYLLYQGFKITRIEPDVGLRFEVQLDLLHISNTNMGQVLTMEFFREHAVDPVFVIYGTPQGYLSTNGMCGTFDACDLNDFVTPEGDFIEGNATYSNEWRVHGPESIFDKYNSNIAYDAQTIRPPIYPKNWKSSAPKHDLGEPELSPEAIYLLCEEVCTQGTSASAWINQQGADNVCGELCDELGSELRDLRLFSVHANYSENPPQINVAHLNGGQKASVRIPVEGTYTFGVRSSDCCNQTEPVNVTLEVKCERKFEVDAGDDINVPVFPFPLPIIQLEGSIKKPGKNSHNIHYSWVVVEWPHKEIGKPAPTIVYPFSLTPYLKPLDVGSYILEVVAFDGCHLSKDTANVTIDCSEPGFYRTVSDTKVMWIDKTPQFSSPFFSYYPICDTVNLPLSTSAVINFTKIKLWDSALELRNESYGAHNNAHSLAFRRNYDHNETNTTSFLPEVVKDSTPLGPVPDKNGLSRTEVNRATVITITTQVTTITTKEYIQRVELKQCDLDAAASNLPGTLAVNLQVTPTDLSSEDMTIPSWIPDSDDDFKRIYSNMKFGYGRCQGTYNYTLTAIKSYRCADFIDTFAFDVTCGAKWTGPLAKPVSPCHTIKYDYQNGGFPLRALDDDSSDRLNRNIQRHWEVVTHPNPTFEWTQNYTQPGSFFELNTTGSVPTFESKIAGKYTLRQTSTNKCEWDSEDFEVAFECTGDLSVNAKSNGTVLRYDYTIGATNEIVITANPMTTAKVATGDRVMATVLGFVVILPNGSETFIASPGPFIVQPSLFHQHDVSSLTISVLATDGCSTKRQAISLTLECASFTVTPNVWNATNIPVFPYLRYQDFQPHSTVHFSYTNTSVNPIQSSVWSFGNGSSSDIVATSPAFVALPFPEGTYIATLLAFDGCRSVKATTPFTLKCLQHSWEIRLDLQIQSHYLDVNATNIVVDGSTTNFTLAFADPIYTATGIWEVTHPDGTVEELKTEVLTLVNPPTGIVFTPRMRGDHLIKLTISDGCKTWVKSVTSTVVCLYSLTAQASQPADVLWQNNKFPIISLNGKSSTTTSPVVPNYGWEVLEAPPGSLFEGRRNIHIDISQTSVEHIPLEDKAETLWWRSSITTRVTDITDKNETYYYIAYLNNNPSEGAFGSCFRPDLPGKYTLQLQMSTICHTSNSTITVEAKCNGAPQLSAQVPTTGINYNPMILDGSATTDIDNDDLSYIWSIYNCTSRVNYAGSLLVNRYSPKAIFTPSHPMEYCISLNVSDGCTEVFEEWTVQVSCNNTEHLIEQQELTVKFNGLELQQVDMEIPINEDVGATWYDSHSYEWTLTAFDPTPLKSATLTDGEIAGIVVGVIAGVALVGAIVTALVMGLMAGGKEGSEIAFPAKS